MFQLSGTRSFRGSSFVIFTGMSLMKSKITAPRTIKIIAINNFNVKEPEIFISTYLNVINKKKFKSPTDNVAMTVFKENKG